MPEEMSAFPGVSRRDFLTFCGWMAALVGVGRIGAAEVAEALESLAKRPSVVWSTFQACTGCAIQLLQTRTPTVADLILKQISVDYQDNVMAAAGDAAEKTFNDAVAAGNFFWVVEGSIPTTIPEAMSVHGKTAMEITKETYPKAKATIAMGSCACYGNIPAANPNPTGAKGVAAVLKEDLGVANPVVVNISRCPGQAEDMIATLSYVLVTGKVPPLDSIGRPTFLYGQTIHDSCFRRGHFEAGEFVEVFGDEATNKDWCLYKVGCKGPVTYAPCGITRWNGHVSWCVQNAPCQGCAEPQFWDKLTPFYERLSAYAGFPAETVGLAAGAVAAVGIGAHFAASAATGRLGKTDSAEDKGQTGEKS